MYYTIYKITNKINNKYYIGKHQTKDLNDGYMGSGVLVTRAIKKHGIESFEKQILFIFDNEQEMNHKEKELVVVSEETYNLCEGGKGGFGYINSNKELEVKRSKSRKITLKQRYGVEYSSQIPSARDKLSKILSGRKTQTELARKRAYELYPNGIFYNKKHSDESKKKISEANKKMIGSKNSQFGTCWITNGKENKKIKKEEINKWNKLGFLLGRI